MRKLLAVSIAAVLTAVCQSNAFALSDTAEGFKTATPIKHLVVIFQENVSFDHYFGTYPNALNLAGEPPFVPAKGTPTVNGLSAGLLTSNATSTSAANGAGATNPFRLSPAQASTADQDHDYTPEQQALHGGLVDLYPKYTGNGGNALHGPLPANSPAIFNTPGLVMGYSD